MLALTLTLAALCVIANAFFVAAEFAFAKVRPSALEALAQEGDAGAARALTMTRHLDAYLSATQLGITLASLGLGWAGHASIAPLLEEPFRAVGLSDLAIHTVAAIAAFGLISLFHIVLGELVPKSWAIQYPERAARLFASPVRWFYLLTRFPAMWLLNGLSDLILRALRVPRPELDEGKLSADEIRLIIQASFRDTDAQDRKRDLLERVLRGTDRPIRAIMVPRVDMVALHAAEDFESSLDLVRRHGYSRYPICDEGNPDKILGYVHVKDLFAATRDGTQSLASLKRDVLFVPETTKVGDLLSEFQLTCIPIAIVVDEYGGTDGMVTVEDVVEEMVGEIQDEHDLERPKIVTRDDGTIAVHGSVPLHELHVEGLDADDDEEPDTIGGFIVSKLGRLARPGDRVRAGRWDLVVEDVRRRRVSRVGLVRRAESELPAPPD
jgi:CBS domain containing-hemolysin-like protein